MALQHAMILQTVAASKEDFESYGEGDIKARSKN